MTARKPRSIPRDPRLEMSEDALEEHVRRLCKDLGVVRVHHRDSRQTTSGWPDDVLLGPGGCLFRELKRQDGRATGTQEAMLAALIVAGQDAAIWRPEDLLSGRIAREITAISALRSRVRA